MLTTATLCVSTLLLLIISSPVALRLAARKVHGSLTVAIVRLSFLMDLISLRCQCWLNDELPGEASAQ